MRFFLYWLIRGIYAALSGGLAMLIMMDLVDFLAVGISAASPAEFAAMTQSELANALKQMMLTGLTCGLMTAVATLGGWRLSRRLAFHWTAVVETGEGDAVVHPAVLHINALSPETRQEWQTSHPAQGRYRFTIAGLLILPDILIVQPAGALPEATAALVPIAYLWGLESRLRKDFHRQADRSQRPEPSARHARRASALWISSAPATLWSSGGWIDLDAMFAGSWNLPVTSNKSASNSQALETISTLQQPLGACSS